MEGETALNLYEWLSYCDRPLNIRRPAEKHVPAVVGHQGVADGRPSLCESGSEDTIVFNHEDPGEALAHGLTGHGHMCGTASVPSYRSLNAWKSL
jgi:hypothetical protein